MFRVGFLINELLKPLSSWSSDFRLFHVGPFPNMLSPLFSACGDHGSALVSGGRWRRERCALVRWQASSHRNSADLEGGGVPVGAGLPAKASEQSIRGVLREIHQWKTIRSSRPWGSAPSAKARMWRTRCLSSTRVRHDHQ